MVLYFRGESNILLIHYTLIRKVLFALPEIESAYLNSRSLKADFQFSHEAPRSEHAASDA